MRVNELHSVPKNGGDQTLNQTSAEKSSYVDFTREKSYLHARSRAGLQTLATNACKCLLVSLALFSCDIQDPSDKSAVQPTIKSETKLILGIEGELAFTDMQVGESETLKITLSSLTTVNVREITTGTLYPPFLLNSSETSCGETLDSGQVCEIAVDFSPQSSGEFSSQLNIRYLNDSHYQSRSVSISGVGYTDTSLSYEESGNWNMGTFSVGETDIQKKFRVDKFGGQDVTSFTLGGELSSPFSYAGGSFPGARGSCTQEIPYSCDIDFSLDTSTFAFTSQAVEASYTLAGEPTTNSLTLTANTVFLFGADDPRKIDGFIFGVESPSFIFHDGTSFYVVDRDSNRVLVYSELNTNYPSVSFVIGQNSASEVLPNKGQESAGATTLSAPSSIYSDGTSLLISDTGNNRVLYFATKPQNSNEVPTHIWAGLASPKHAVIHEGKIIVANTADSKLLSMNISDIGTETEPSELAITVDNPVFIDFEGSSIWVVNSGATKNVEKYDSPFSEPSKTITLDSGETPSIVGPSAIQKFGSEYYVTDKDGHQVLVYSDISSDNPGPSHIIGVTGDSTTADNTLSSPSNVVIVDGRLLVSDEGHKRVAGFSTAPTTDSESADTVIFQSDFTTYRSYNSASTYTSFHEPQAAYSNGRFVVSDTGAQRFLSYGQSISTSNQDPSQTTESVASGEPAISFVSDQFFTFVSSPGSATVYHGTGEPDTFEFSSQITASQTVISICSNSTFLYLLLSTGDIDRYTVADPPVFEETFTPSGITGQQTLSCNNNFVTLSSPSTVVIYQKTDGASLAAADTPDYTTTGFSGRFFAGITGAVTTASARLFVSDPENRRVLIWTDLDSLSSDPSFLVGQTSLSKTATAPHAGTLVRPWHLSDGGDRVLVSDKKTGRVIHIPIP